MTALSTPDGQSLNLICDECGESLTQISSGVRDWDVVWALVSKHGWTGSALAIGTHRCPRCSAAGSSPADGAPAPVSTQRPREPWRGPSRVVGDAVVVDLRGDLDVEVVADLRNFLAQACEDYRHLVLDLTGVRLIDSAALGVLVRARQVVGERGGLVCLAAPSRFIVTVLHTMRLHGLFPIFGDRDRALRWLATADHR